MTLEEDRDAKGPSTIAVRAGESLNTCKINFSPDGKWIFVCCGSRVEVYSYTSHDIVYTLSYHSAAVTGIAVNPRNKMQLLSASLDGCLAVWDYTDGSLLKVVDFGRPLFKFGVRPGNREPSIFFTVQKSGVTPESKDADYAVVGVASHVITERKPSVAPSNLLEDSQRYLQTRKKPRDLVFSHEGSYVASYSGKKLMLCDVEAENFYNYHLEHAITAVTFHPCKMCLATGNTHGEIHLWYDFAQPGSRVVTTTMHWHAHAVGDICFTSDVLWCVKTSVDLLISDPFSSLAATFVPSLSGETHLYVFNPSSPTPLAVHDSVCPGPVVGAVFMPQTRTSKHPPSSSSSSSSSPPSSTLYFINKQQVLYSLSSQRDDQDQENNSSLGGSTGPTVNPPATTGGGQFDSQKAFREIFGRATLREEEKEADRLGGGGGGGGGGGVVVPPRSSSAVRQQLLSAPAHVLPPISALCTPFLLTLLPASDTAAAAAAGSDGGALNGDDVDSEMEHSAARDSDSEEEEEEEEESSSQPGQQDSSSTTARSLAAAHKPTTAGVGWKEEEEEGTAAAAAAAGQSLRESGSVGDYEWLTEQFGVL